jgi:hypothetical protein
MLVSEKRATALGTPILVAMYMVIGAFMLLSLAVTATGTARRARSLGRRTRATQRLAGQPGMQSHPGKYALRLGLRAGRAAAP